MEWKSWRDMPEGEVFECEEKPLWRGVRYGKRVTCLVDANGDKTAEPFRPMGRSDDWFNRCRLTGEKPGGIKPKPEPEAKPLLEWDETDDGVFEAASSLYDDGVPICWKITLSDAVRGSWTLERSDGELCPPEGVTYERFAAAVEAAEALDRRIRDEEAAIAKVDEALAEAKPLIDGPGRYPIEEGGFAVIENYPTDQGCCTGRGPKPGDRHIGWNVDGTLQWVGRRPGLRIVGPRIIEEAKPLCIEGPCRCRMRNGGYASVLRRSDNKRLCWAGSIDGIQGVVQTWQSDGRFLRSEDDSIFDIVEIIEPAPVETPAEPKPTHRYLVRFAREVAGLDPKETIVTAASYEHVTCGADRYFDFTSADGTRVASFAAHRVVAVELQADCSCHEPLLHANVGNSPAGD